MAGAKTPTLQLSRAAVRRAVREEIEGVQIQTCAIPKCSSTT
jgi:hypothetical protein